MTHPLMHPFAPPAKAEEDFVNIVRAQGCTLWDDDGKTYIDGLGSLWYCQVGHGRADMVDAIRDQLMTMGSTNTFDTFTNEPAALAAEMILDRSPFETGRVFFGCSGSEAIDTALKLARLTHQLRGDADRQIVVKRTHGYHGTNFGGTSAQGIEPNRTGWGDLVPHFVEVPHDDVEALATVFANHGPRIAAVLTEPVQGAGGVLMAPDGYLEGARRLCDDHGALLIFDEVICGFGRTGSWFGSQTFGVTPDLITFAKGVTSGYLPLSGVIIGPEASETIEGMDGVLRTGYTYSGHPASCAAAIKNMEIIEAEGLVERANQIGETWSAGLAALQNDGLIASYRGVGALWALELERDAIGPRDELRDNHGVVLRGIGTCLAFSPPLVITDAELATMLDALADLLAN